MTAGSTLKLIAVIVPLGPDTLGVALALGIATESDVGWDCCSSSEATAPSEDALDVGMVI